MHTFILCGAWNVGDASWIIKLCTRSVVLAFASHYRQGTHLVRTRTLWSTLPNPPPRPPRIKVRKFHQLEEASALMDDLAPSLKYASTGGVGKERGADKFGGDGPASGKAVKDATVVGRCTAAALGTGVDCVLAEEFSASREPARTRGFAQVTRKSRHACIIHQYVGL